MNFIDQNLERIVQFIVRPRRTLYDQHELGPIWFRHRGKTYVRTDFEAVHLSNDFPQAIGSK